MSALVGGALTGTLAACGSEPRLTGTDLGKRPAPDFTLTDQRGQALRLHDFRGRAVVLTFIYTHCPDVCPLIAENLRVTDKLLSAKVRSRVAFLAVTIDPARDTTAALLAFSVTHGLAGNPRWYTLRGDLASLEPVWRSYGIYPGLLPADGTPAVAYSLGHTDAIYVIDPEGRERVLLHSDVSP